MSDRTVLRENILLLDGNIFDWSENVVWKYGSTDICSIAQQVYMGFFQYNVLGTQLNIVEVPSGYTIIGTGAGLNNFDLTSALAGKLSVDTLLNAATGNEVACTLAYTVNKLTSGNDTGLLISMTDTASPGTSLPLDVQVGSSTTLCVRADGNVGIGTNTPTGLLSLYSTVTTAIGPVVLWVGEPGYPTYGANFRASAVTGSYSWYFVNDGTEDVTPTLAMNRVTGYVGIGTLSPDSKLQVAGNVIVGDAAADTDYTLTFDGQTNDGVLTWMEDEDYLKSSDDLLLDSTERVYFRDTGQSVSSANSGDLDIDAGTSIDLLIGTTEQMTLTDGKLAPTTDNDIDLGDTTHRFKALHMYPYERHVQLDAKADGSPANQPAQVDFFTAGGLQFSASAAKYAYCQWEVPDDWDGGNVYFEIDWMPDSGATSGTDAVRWTVEYRAIAEGEALNNGTSVTLDNGAGGDTADYAQYVTKHTRVTLVYNNADQPLTKQDHVYFKISRDVGVTNDFAGTVTVLAYEVIYNSVGIPTSN